MGFHHSTTFDGSRPAFRGLPAAAHFNLVNQGELVLCEGASSVLNM